MKTKIFKALVAFVAIFVCVNADSLKTPNYADKTERLAEAIKQYNALLNAYFDISAEFFALTKRVDSSSTEAQNAIKIGMAEATKVGAIVKNKEDRDTQISLAYEEVDMAFKEEDSPERKKRFENAHNNFQSLIKQHITLLNQSTAELKQIKSVIEKSIATLKKYDK